MKIQMKNQKKRTGLKSVLGLFLAGMLCGCGVSQINTNVTAGMGAIENLNYEEAITNFEKALENGEDERLIYRGLGIAYMGLTDYEQAIANFEQCLTLSDGMVQNMDYDVNYYLAASYYKSGQIEKAEDTYTAILNLKSSEEAYFLRGTMRLERGEYDSALEDFEQVLKITDNNERLFEIYEVLAKYGYQEIGQEYLQSALETNEAKMSVYDKGRLYYYLQDYRNACNYLEQARDAGPAEAYLYLGKAYEATGDYNYAASVYNSFLANDQTNARVYNQLGLCELQRQDYEAALSVFQTAMKIEENGIMQSLQFNEIIAYEYLGEYRKAAVLMDNYIKMYPDDQTAAREYEFLKTR